MNLFDICSCKCTNLECCDCPKDQRVPKIEREFLIDQRTQRRMVIGTVDKPTTKLLEKRLERTERAPKRKHIETKPIASTSQVDNVDVDFVLPSRSAKIAGMNFSFLMLNQDHVTSPSESASEGSAGKWSKLSTSTIQNRIRLDNTAMVADRFDSSDTCAAAFATAAYVDAGLITLEDQHLVVDRAKVRRARYTLRTTNVENFRGEIVHAFFFDGRKDKTICMRFGRIAQTVEEHISILREPGSIFLSHVTVENGESLTITNTIRDRLEDKNIEKSTVKAIGCDSTNVNVGVKGGVIRLFELELQTNLQWLVCLLHMNELPLRVLLYKYVGKSKDPRNFTGPLGEMLPRCESMPIVQFERMDFGGDMEMENIDTSAFNADNKYLFDICRIICTGIIPANFENRSIGTCTTILYKYFHFIPTLTLHSLY